MDGFEAQGYAFGSFRLVPQDQILLKDGAPVDLTPQMFEVLHLLVRRHGHLVEREELIGHLWPDTVVGENSLSQCIYLLRKVLDNGNRENGPSVIETVPRRGYRFTVDVRTLTEDAAADLSKPSASQIPKPQTIDSQTAESPANRPLEHSLFRSLTARRTIAVAALAALVLLAMAALRLGRQGQSRDIAVINPRSLSVLPFDNLSPMTAKAGDEYIAKGLTQELSAEFARLPGVKVVIGRLPSAKPGDGIDPHAVGSSLHVENILVGSVRESGAQYRVTVQLIKTSDGQELWSGVYTASVADIPSVEEQVIRHAADVLQVPWSASNDEQWTRRRVEDPKAHDLYLQGRYFWSKRDMASMQRSIELLQQAIAQDPTYARAYAGLADTFAVMAANGQMPAGEALPKARAAAAKALELDPTMAEPHATLGLLLFEFDWDFPGRRGVSQSAGLKSELCHGTSLGGTEFDGPWKIRRCRRGIAQGAGTGPVVAADLRGKVRELFRVA
jgi:DNA-binding winged helix-turn-helix (wHTH) protein/TolB-like protein